MGPGSRPGRREIVASAPCISSTGLKFQTALQTCLRDLAASSARGLAGNFLPSKIRGRREDRVRAAPAVSRAKVRKENAHEHTGTDGTLRHSLRNGFTAYIVLSPENGSFASVVPEKRTSREFDASTATSGPHDFAVRIMRLRLLRTPRPPHLTARS